jgi:hypothetical protein
LIAVILVLAALFWVARLHPEQMQSLARQWGGTFSESAHLPLVLHNFNRMLALTALVLLVVFFGLRHRLVRLGSPLLLMLLTLDLFLGNRGYAVKLDAATFHADNTIIRTLRADPALFRFHVLPEARDLEIPVESYEEAHQNRKKLLGNDLMMEHHLFDITGYNVPLQPRYENVIGLILNKPLDSIRALLDLQNVKYVLAAEPVDLPGFSWIADGAGPSKLYENHHSLPRAFLVKQFQVIKSEQEYARAFIELTFDPASTILLDGAPTSFLALKKKPAVPDLKPAVRVLTYENNRIVLEVDSPEAAFLFMSEAHYPGWKAYVDGREEEILRADYVFRAIPVGPGSHRIEVGYQPLSFKVGLMVSLLTIVMLVTIWVILAIRRRVTLGMQGSGGPKRL